MIDEHSQRRLWVGESFLAAAVTLPALRFRDIWQRMVDTLRSLSDYGA